MWRMNVHHVPMSTVGLVYICGVPGLMYTFTHGNITMYTRLARCSRMQKGNCKDCATGIAF